ncbi:hypothetical protein AB1N83_012196, partial [Pleurotus pulmonarius]
MANASDSAKNSTGTHGEPMLHRNSTGSCFGLQWFSFPRHINSLTDLLTQSNRA